MKFFFLFTSWLSVYVIASCWSNIKTDIVFVVDSSDSISDADWELMKVFIGDLVEQNLPDDGRVGFLGFGSTTFVEFGLEQYQTAADISNRIKYEINQLRKDRQTLNAIEDAYDYIFVPDRVQDRAKKLLLFTYGQPDADSDPCSFSTTLKASGIEVTIVAVGDWLDSTNMACLVNDADTDILEVENFSQIQYISTELKEVICGNGYNFNIIEVQPYPGTSPRFIEIYNAGDEMEAYNMAFSGLYNGIISMSVKVPQGHILLVSDDSELDGDCGSGCVFYHWEQGVTEYQEQSQEGVISVGYSISLTLPGGVLVESIHADDFPRIKRGYSFELSFTVSNPSVGSNQRMSCEEGGSPGDLPEEDCGLCTSDGDCEFQGDSDADCSGGCSCSTGFYPKGPTCAVLPVPSDCIVHGVPGEEDRYYFDWVQPDFMDAATFSGTKINYYLGGSTKASTLTVNEAPPTSSFEIREEHRDEVKLWSMFTIENEEYVTNNISCTVMDAPTFYPSGSPSRVPTRIPTSLPSASPVPHVQECTLKILDNTMTVAVISWVYDGNYVVGGENQNPQGFQLSWGETSTSLASTVAWPSSEESVSLLAKWDYTRVVAEVIVEGYERNATVLSDPVICAVIQATPSPVAYPVPAPESCTALVRIREMLADVTITGPSEDYAPNGVITTVRLLVRVTSNFITNYELGENVFTQSVIIDEDDFVGISAISLGTESIGSTTIHPESPATPCTVETHSPTEKPVAPDSKYPVPAIQSCDVLVASGSTGTDTHVRVTITWVPPAYGDYNHDGTPMDLYGYKYRLGGDTSWKTVEGQDETIKWELWNREDANKARLTYMVAMGTEIVAGEEVHPISDNERSCTITTYDPTKSPTQAPSRHPTRAPSRMPTNAPTFPVPTVSFRQTDYTTGEVEYTAKEMDYIGFTIQVEPASLLPIEIRWELVDNSTGLQPTSGFQETNGTIWIGQFRDTYPVGSPGCAHGGNCISSYSCISHLYSDYCVQDLGEVYEQIEIMAFDNAVDEDAEDARIFKLRFSSGGSYIDDEFYGNSDHYSIDATLNEATLRLFGANAAAFCIAVPTDISCGGITTAEGLLWWHYLIAVVVLLIVIALLYFAYRKHVKAQEAKRQKKRLDKELDNELKNAEEDFGVGPTDTVNPLALRKMQEGARTKTKMAPTKPIESDDEGMDDGAEGFSTMVQFNQNC